MSPRDFRDDPLTGHIADMAKSTKLTQLRHSANDYSITLLARAPLRMVFKELRRHDPARPEGHEDQ